MKASKYNFTMQVDSLDQILMYNAFTASLALVDQDKVQIFEDFCQNQTPITDEEFVKALKQGGFLVDDNVDELKEIELNMFKDRYDSSSISLTIAPTMDCNFNCTYCYEKSRIHTQYMSQEVQEAIVHYVDKLAARAKHLTIHWYGGEPLLALDTIELLSQQFLKICEDNNVDYDADIITNGYLLSREAVEKLLQCKISHIQITIDGTRESHNKRRPLRATGEGTYDTILQNIIDLYDILPRVALRVNVDKSNVESIDEIVTMVKEAGLSEKVTPYLGKVTNDDDDPSLCNVCYTDQEFSKIDINYSMRNADSVNWMSKYPTFMSSYCGADCLFSYVIAPNGGLYKCWNDIDDSSKMVGNIVDGSRNNNELLYSYLLYNPIDDKCKDCKLLPLCIGGCPYSRVNQKPDRCSIYKLSLKQYLEMITEQILATQTK